MAFDWRDFIGLAVQIKVLAEQGLLTYREAAYRCAIGRVYFAAFGYAINFAKDYLDFRPSPRVEERTSDHGRIRAHLRSKRRALVAEKLNRLRDWRNLCDYEDELTDLDLPDILDSALAEADYVLKALSPPKSPKA